MRILFLADAVQSDKAGGSRVVAYELARRLVQRGHEVTFLVARNHEASPAIELQEGFRIVRYDGAGEWRRYPLEGEAACAALWQESPFEIVHTHFAYAALGPLRAIPASVPHVRSFYGPWDEEGWVEDIATAHSMQEHFKARLKKYRRRQIERENLLRSRTVIVLSHYSSDIAVKQFGVPIERIRLIPGGVDSTRFKPAGNKTELRSRLSFTTVSPLLLSIRRLTPRMGLDRLIKAMPRVVAQYPDALLLIGGQGPQRDTLLGHINQLGLEKQVRLVGFIPDEELPHYYSAADLFILPTLTLEGFGLVTTEALSCGTPVLGTPSGATPEILSQLDDGLVTHGMEVEDIATGILGFLHRQAEWNAKYSPDALRDWVVQRYNWDYHTDQVEAVYRDAIENPVRTYKKEAAPA